MQSRSIALESPLDLLDFRIVLKHKTGTMPPRNLVKKLLLTEPLLSNYIDYYNLSLYI